MQASDPVRVARALFEAYRRRDEAAMLRLAHTDVRINATSWGSLAGHSGISSTIGDPAAGPPEIEITPHSFELIPPEHVLVGGRLRVFRRGLRDSPAWWILTIRDGLWVSGTSHPSEAAARAALPALV